MSKSLIPDIESSTSSRFSLILLEPDEIYFEDYLVYYNELKCPFSDNNSDSSTNNQLKGNLKICSKSFVFDPINLNYPLVKFPYKSIEKIVKFDEYENNDSNELIGEDEDIYSTNNKTSLFSTNSSKLSLNKNELNQLKKKTFAINTKQVIKCKANNKIGPYNIVKRDKQNDLHYFQFIFTNVNDSLDLLCQLHRASTLEYEQEDLMLQLILKSRLSRNFEFDVHQLDDMFKEQIQFESIVNKINPLVANPGRIILTNMCLYYKPFNNLDNEQKLLKIKLKQIKYVIKRRYHLKKIGCEIVFNNKLTTSKLSFEESLDSSNSSSSNMNSSNSNNNDRKSLPYLYLTFEDELTRDKFYDRLVIDQRDKLVNLDEFNQENMLQSWRYGTISNFDYLMYLNNMADRSYNDLTQYPVFPWVLNDYTSENLDLNDPKTFRDLSKPVGALNEERLNRLRQRCKDMQVALTGFNKKAADEEEKGKQPIFLYGSHYSTPAFVLFYLVRQYPEWQLCLQNGRFDHPNRLFHSISDTWKNCLQIDSDVKELIPEFFDTGNESDRTKLGSFLRNDLELDLGVRQDHIRVNHVILPTWANNSPSEFIQKMREALESPIVSENLHKWIDLIFGYKQQGDEALKADNLFYYLCYEGAVDLNSIENYSERKSLEIQIQEFGQIPTQLFRTAHLPRVKKDLLAESKLLSKSEEEKNGQFYLSNEMDKKLDLNNEDVFENSIKKNNNIKTNLKNSKKINKNNEKLSNPFRINTSNFKQLTVKLDVKLHKGQINDCLFIENRNQSTQADSNDYLSKRENDFDLPLVCSVSNDYWIKTYSLEDKSIFRSHNVSNFSISSVDCLQLITTKDDSNDNHDNRHTLLFLSSWDNSMYIYDINYNRCVHTVSNMHDDALSKCRIINNKTNTLILTSSWDSLIKVWRAPTLKKNNKKLDIMHDAIKVEYLSELCHDSSVVEFHLSKSYLASICDDGNLYLWKLNKKILDDDSTEFESSDEESTSQDEDEIIDDSNTIDFDNLFTFLYTIQSSSDTGKINDCKIIESSNMDINNSQTKNAITTLAICTSLGYIKIFNIATNCELFSLKLNVPGMVNVKSKLNKLFYRLDYIIAIDSMGFIYFIDLQKQSDNYNGNNNLNSADLLKRSNSFSSTSLINSQSSSSSASTFLSHTIKVSSNCLNCLSIYKESIICTGDSEGNLYFLSLIDF